MRESRALAIAATRRLLRIDFTIPTALGPAGFVAAVFAEPYRLPYNPKHEQR
jgi:hypothetical protein